MQGETAELRRNGAQRENCQTTKKNESSRPKNEHLTGTLGHSATISHQSIDTRGEILYRERSTRRKRMSEEAHKDGRIADCQNHQLNDVRGIDVEVGSQPARLRSRAKLQGKDEKEAMTSLRPLCIFHSVYYFSLYPLCTFQSVHSVPFSPLCTFHSVHFVPFTPSTLYLHSVPFTPLCSVPFTPSTLHLSLRRFCTFHFSHFSLFSTVEVPTCDTGFLHEKWPPFWGSSKLIFWKCIL